MRRYKHNLSHYHNLTGDMGYLLPVACVEVLPGDTIQHHTSMLLRTNPLKAPVMHPVLARIHHWYVPYRIVWEDWESFITGGEDGLDDSAYPTISLVGSARDEGSLADYLGIPTGTDVEVSALPFRAVAMIYNEWYRDTQLQTEVGLDVSGGSDTTTNTNLLRCNWEKDYFTTARPDEQLGPQVSLPLGTSADVLSDGTQPTFSSVGSSQNAGMTYNTSVGFQAATNLGNNSVKFGDNSGLYADLSNATASTVNDLRQAFALQRFLEMRNRYGGRYVEYLRALGVPTQDGRLQRPEYLGGGKQTLQFSEVLSTADSGASDVGDLKGHGIAAMRSNRYRKFFGEHGVIISFLSVKPKTMYSQGLHKMWSRRTKGDFWQKEFEAMGMAEVLNKEIYLPHTSPDGTFGYQDRYDEYRRHPSGVHGEFRSSLDFWHMARSFSSDPALNSSFVTAVPTDRIYSTTDTHELFVMADNRMIARRLVAKQARISGLF